MINKLQRNLAVIQFKSPLIILFNERVICTRTISRRRFDAYQVECDDDLSPFQRIMTKFNESKNIS